MIAIIDSAVYRPASCTHFLISKRLYHKPIPVMFVAQQNIGIGWVCMDSDYEIKWK